MSSKQLIDSIIEAHGGLERYSSLSSVDVNFDFTGATLALKGRATHLTPKVSVSTKEQKVTYRGLGGPADETWVFTRSRVYKQSSDGAIFDSRESPRAAFAGHTMETPWDDFHFLYFVGYALWQYINFPYILDRDDITIRELAPHDELGETWRVLEASFPDPNTSLNALASHNQTQRYFFNSKLELVRHDYAPDVLGGAAAAHYSVDNVRVGGMKFSTMRRVVAKDQDGKPMYNGPIPTLINLVFTRIEVKRSSGQTSPEDVWSLTSAPTP